MKTKSFLYHKKSTNASIALSNGRQTTLLIAKTRSLTRRKWLSKLLLLGIIFSTLAFTAKAAPEVFSEPMLGYVPGHGWRYGLFTFCEDGAYTYEQILEDGMYGPPLIVEIDPDGNPMKRHISNELESFVSIVDNRIVIENAQNVELYEAESSKKLNNSIITQTSTSIYQLDFTALPNSVYVINYLSTNNVPMQRLFIKSENQAFLNNIGGQK